MIPNDFFHSRRACKTGLGEAARIQHCHAACSQQYAAMWQRGDGIENQSHLRRRQAAEHTKDKMQLMKLELKGPESENLSR